MTSLLGRHNNDNDNNSDDEQGDQEPDDNTAPGQPMMLMPEVPMFVEVYHWRTRLESVLCHDIELDS